MATRRMEGTWRSRWRRRRPPTPGAFFETAAGVEAQRCPIGSALPQLPHRAGRAPGATPAASAAEKFHRSILAADAEGGAGGAVPTSTGGSGSTVPDLALHLPPRQAHPRISSTATAPPQVPPFRIFLIIAAAGVLRRVEPERQQSPRTPRRRSTSSSRLGRQVRSRCRRACHRKDRADFQRRRASATCMKEKFGTPKASDSATTKWLRGAAGPRPWNNRRTPTRLALAELERSVLAVLMLPIAAVMLGRAVPVQEAHSTSSTTLIFSMHSLSFQGLADLDRTSCTGAYGCHWARSCAALGSRPSTCSSICAATYKHRAWFGNPDPHVPAVHRLARSPSPSCSLGLLLVGLATV